MNMSRLSLGVFGVCLAIFFFIHNIEYPARAAQIPLIFSTAVGLLSLAWIVQQVWSVRKLRRTAVGTSTFSSSITAAAPSAYGRYVKAFSIYAVALMYAYSIGVVGYFIASAMFMGLALLIVREVGVRYALVGSGALLGTIGLVFFYFLGLNMPMLPTFL